MSAVARSGPKSGAAGRRPGNLAGGRAGKHGPVPAASAAAAGAVETDGAARSMPSSHTGPRRSRCGGRRSRPSPPGPESAARVSSASASSVVTPTAGIFKGKRKPARGRHADPDAGEGARPGRNGDAAEIGKAQPGSLQRLFDDAHQMLGMALAEVDHGAAEFAAAFLVEDAAAQSRSAVSMASRFMAGRSSARLALQLQPRHAAPARCSRWAARGP